MRHNTTNFKRKTNIWKEIQIKSEFFLRMNKKKLAQMLKSIHIYYIENKSQARTRNMLRCHANEIPEHLSK